MHREGYHHLDKEGALSGYKKRKDLWRDGEILSLASRTARGSTGEENPAQCMGAPRSRAFSNYRSLNCRTQSLSPCRWRHGCRYFLISGIVTLNRGKRCRQKCVALTSTDQSVCRRGPYIISLLERERGRIVCERERGGERVRASRLLFVSPKLRGETDGPTGVSTIPPFLFSPPSECFLSRSAASAPVTKMHRLRPAQELTLFLPVALWIFSHVNGVHGALPTTRKLLFLIYLFFFGCVSLRGAGTLCGKQTDCASGAETVRLLARRILGGVFKSQAAEAGGGLFSEFRLPSVNSSGVSDFLLVWEF